MKSAEFQALCRGVESGGEHFVEDLTTHKVGKVVSCEGNRIEVDIDGENQTWPSASCREKWMTSR